MTATTPTRGHLAKIRDDLEFYPHQIEGVRELDRRTSFILADEMGLGKSIQALTVAAVAFERGETSRILVICPASLKGNWADEIKAHTLFSTTVLAGSRKQRDKQLETLATDILIVNYEQVESHLARLNGMGFGIAIYDEAHYIKGRKSARTRACQGLRMPRHFLLTGSPLLNQVDDLWTLLNRIDPAEFPTYWRFVNRYCNTPDAPILMADGTMKPIGEIVAGELVMGWHVPDVSTARRGAVRVATDSPNRRRMMVASEVQEVRRRMAEVWRFDLEDGESITCTADHQWLSGSHNDSFGWTTAMPHDRGPGKGTKLLSRVCSLPGNPTPEQQRAADWISGMFDGEGTWPSIAQYVKANPAVHAAIARALDVLEIKYSVTDKTYTLLGGRDTLIRMRAWGCMVKTDKMEYKLMGQLNRRGVRVINATPIGYGEVVSMQTTTGNYVAWGLASKNCVYGGYQDRQIVGIKNELELREKLQTRMLRREKKDVLDLPDKQHIVIRLDMSPLQRKLYEQMRDELRVDAPSLEDGELTSPNAMTKMLRLKQICGTCSIVPGQPDDSAKLDRAVEMVREMIDSNEPVVIFTQFREVLARMVDRLVKAGLSPRQLHGDIPVDSRMPIVRDWTDDNNAGNAQPIVCMFQVAGVGLNMTSAARLIFLDKLYVPKLNEQAEDRLHRIGADKTQPIQIFHLHMRNTIDSRIEAILKRKSDIFDTVVTTDNSEWKKKLIAAVLADEDDEPDDS
jgi:hypothetical protein